MRVLGENGFYVKESGGGWKKGAFTFRNNGNLTAFLLGEKQATEARQFLK